MKDGLTTKTERKQNHMKSMFAELMEIKEERLAFGEESAITNAGELIAEALEAKGWSQKRLAEEMDVSPDRVCKLLEGSSKITLATFGKAMAAMGLAVEMSSREIMQIEEQPATPEPHKLNYNHVGMRVEAWHREAAGSVTGVLVGIEDIENRAYVVRMDIESEPLGRFDLVRLVTGIAPDEFTAAGTMLTQKSTNVGGSVPSGSVGPARWYADEGYVIADHQPQLEEGGE